MAWYIKFFKSWICLTNKMKRVVSLKVSILEEKKVSKYQELVGKSLPERKFGIDSATNIIMFV